jgi:NADH dehydrogenase
VVPVIDGGKTLLQPVSLENVVGPLARTVTMPETQGKTYQIGGPERVKFVAIMDRVARVYEVWPNAMNISSFFASGSTWPAVTATAPGGCRYRPAS